MDVGDHIRVTSGDNLGALSRDCWSVTEGRLRTRLRFDPEVTFSVGDQGVIVEHDDELVRVGDPGWFIVDIQGFAVPLHERMMEVVE